MCKETGKLRQKLSFLQFMQCMQPYNYCFLHFRYGASIHFKQILWKNCFLPKWNIGLKWIKYIPKKITTTKHCCFFYENRQEQLIWQKITMSSRNKTFKQVLSFLSNLTSALFILRIALSSHLSEIRIKFLN